MPLIQARLCVILREICRTEEYVLHPQPVVNHVSPVIIESHNHELAVDAGGTFCARCGLRPADAELPKVACRGMSRNPISAPPSIPRPVRIGAGIHAVIAGKVLHPSHSLWFLRGQFWCEKCGHTAGRVSRSLMGRCTRVISAGGGYRIKELLAGRLPNGYAGWPDQLAQLGVQW